MEQNPKIKILISYHKPSVLLKDEVLTPIHLGRAIAKEGAKDGTMNESDYQWMLDNMMGDDTGDNISHLNRKFCEMTGVYWAWKNYDKLGNPDYIGFMHYRRHFIFNREKTRISSVDCTPFPVIDEIYIKKTGLSAEKIKEKIKDFDIIEYAPFAYDSNVYDQFSELEGMDCGLNREIFDKAIEELLAQNPDYKNVVNEYLKQYNHHWYNCFIMKKEIFFDYCNFVFKILLKLEKEIDLSGETLNGQRVFGYISERILGVYMTKLEKENKHKIKYLPITLVENTEIEKDLEPAFAKNNVPICFSCDDNYIPYLGVALQSLIENSSDKNNYDIVILDDKITKFNKDLLLSMVKNKNNFKIRFVDIYKYLNHTNDNFHICNWYTQSTYFRFFVPTIFKNFEKILYLDSDIVILDDVAKLFNIDLKNKIIGAIQDIEAIRWLSNPSVKRELGIYHKKYGIKDSTKYFQAGVLVLNVKKMIEENLQQKLFAKLQEVKTPMCVDQDILNMVCFGDVEYFDTAWNIEWIVNIKSGDLTKELPVDCYYNFKKACENPKIIHYCDYVKPWQKPKLPLAGYFWQYARISPFYEQILYDNLTAKKRTKTDENNKKSILRYVAYDLLTKVSSGGLKKHFNKKRKLYKYAFMKD